MIAIFIFLYGLIIGSFINVCAYRIPKKKSIIFPNSRCPICNIPIKFYDNIPLLSFILLRGKCRHCEGRISIRYPLVELTTGLMFVAAYFLLGWVWSLVPALVLISLLLTIFLIDMDLQIIPNGLIIFGFSTGFIFLAASFIVGGFPLIKSGFNPVLASIGSSVAAGVLLLAIAFIAKLILKKEAMGGGDIKLAAVLGMFLGPFVFLALFFSFFVGAITSVLLMGSGLVKKGKPIAFGPFMAIGAMLTLFIGPQVWHWYLAFIL